MSKKKNKFDTMAIHAGDPSPRIGGAVTPPIFQSATFEYEAGVSYHDIKYARLSNTPTHVALHAKIAALEGGEAAIVSASGMAAISTALLTFLKSGDHILMQNCLYGGTHGLVMQDFPQLGISVDFIDADAPKTWAKKLKPNTKIIYIESISNPTLEIPDFESIAKFAKANKLISIIDNTIASPVNLRPIEHGIDIVVHSATKYLNGHSDLIAGATIGSKKHIKEITHKLNHLGGSLDPHACFLLNRGIQTLGVRVRKQNESALKIARFLEGHVKIEKVHYPGLKSHAQNVRAAKLFNGFGGMISFCVKGGHKAAMKIVEKVQIAAHAPSLGGVESLITCPMLTTHGDMPKSERDRMGVTDNLIRYSVGLEDADDLIADLELGLG